MTILKGAGADERTINYDYDGANRPWHIVSAAGNFTFTYDKRGRRDTLTYPNGTTADWDFDDLDRLTAITHKIIDGAAFASFTYPLYDKAGNIKQISGSRNETYLYDEIYRLTDSVTAKGTEKFTYDPAGNRLSGPGPKDTGYAYNDANQMTAGRNLAYTYDNMGNQADRIIPGVTDKSWSQYWDYENRLVKVEKIKGAERRTVSFRYDPFGRRIEKKLETVIRGVTKSITWSYLYDEEDIALEILDNGTITTRTYYTHGPGIDEPLALERNGQFYFYYADHLGSIVVITDSARNVVQSYQYDSFGMVKATTNFANNYTFQGREWDPQTGLYYYRARYYDPLAGRFISKDPIGIAGGDVNLYGFVRNNPVNWIDPDGLAKRDPNSQYCKSLANRISNLESELEKRYLEYEQDPLNLPERIGPGEGLHETRRGHRTKINETDSRLKKNLQKYWDECGPPPMPGSKPSEKNCDDKSITDNGTVKAVATGAGTALGGYLLYRGLRMLPSVVFPPLWPTIPLNAAAP